LEEIKIILEIVFAPQSDISRERLDQIKVLIVFCFYEMRKNPSFDRVKNIIPKEKKTVSQIHGKKKMKIHRLPSAPEKKLKTC